MMTSDDPTIKSSSTLHAPLAHDLHLAQRSKVSTQGAESLRSIAIGAAKGSVPIDTPTGSAEVPQSIANGAAPSTEQPAPIPVSLALQNDTSERHMKQRIDPETDLFAISTPEFMPLTKQPLPINDRYRRFRLSADTNGTKVPNQTFKSLDDKPLLQDAIYLFNVIVALEWKPSRTTIQQLMSALRDASDFLYDCTNGHMAFGQVIFAIDTLLDKADIQIMASNRFHPRSLVNGLNDPNKYSPIRIGRGLWDKSNGVLIGWDEPIAYRTIIHEWGHYALSLRDEYIDEAKFVKTEQLRLVDAELKERKYTLVVPKLSVVLESIMARLEASEIVPRQRRNIPEDVRKRLLNELEIWYPGVSLTGRTNAGPHRLPLPLPQFCATSELKSESYQSEEALLQVGNLDALDPCWLYLLRWNAESYELEWIKAQGTIDARARDMPLDEDNGMVDGAMSLDKNTINVDGLGFQLLGATAGSEVIAIGYERNEPNGGPKVLRIQRTTLDATIGTGESLMHNPTWNTSVTPSALPIITVMPTDVSLTWPDVDVKVRIVAGSQSTYVKPTYAWIVPTGQKPLKLDLEPMQETPKCQVWESNSIQTTFLDGLVVLQYGTGADGAFWVCEYSHGGNPPTSIRSPSSPVSAGSSDGNLMLYCRTTEDPKLFSHTRVITTRNYATFSQMATHGQIGTAVLSGEVYGPEGELPGEPASYLFSVASNVDIGDAAPADISVAAPAASRKIDLNPTIVMYFDLNALDEKGDLIIHRYDVTTGTWKALPTYQKPGTFFAAIPLNDLLPDQIAYYQLFRVAR